MSRLLPSPPQCSNCAIGAADMDLYYPGHPDILFCPDCFSSVDMDAFLTQHHTKVPLPPQESKGCANPSKTLPAPTTLQHNPDPAKRADWMPSSESKSKPSFKTSESVVILAVTWAKKPFGRMKIYRGTKSEIECAMQTSQDCAFICCESDVAMCLYGGQLMNSPSQFEDKYHGVWAATASAYDTLSDDDVLHMIQSKYSFDPWFDAELGRSLICVMR